METRYFETLVKVVEAGSFSRAAEMLHLTQSAVSQRIKFLEEQYNHSLLDRSGAVLLPTEAGRLVLEKARVIVAMEREIVEEMKRLGSRKHLSLCCTPTFGMAFLPRIINDFIRRNSDVADLKFIFSQPEQALKGLRENEFDLAVIEHCGCDLEPFDTCPLPDDELVFISAPALGIPPSPVDLEVLLCHRLYARRDGCSSKNLLRSNLDALGRDVGDFHTVVISDDLRFSIEAVMGGDGVSFVSSSLVEEHLERGALCSHHVNGFQHFRARTAVFMEKRHAGSAASMLKSFLACVCNAFAPSVKIADEVEKESRLCLTSSTPNG